MDWIIRGKKTWEIRSRSTNIRGRIGLIKSKSLTVVGTCEIVDVVGPLTAAMIQKNARSKMNEAPGDCADCVGQYAWVLADVRRILQPVPYTHPSGAIVEARRAKSRSGARGEVGERRLMVDWRAPGSAS